jgi:hypothetical protein
MNEDLLKAARHLEEAAMILRSIAAPTIPARREGWITDFLDSGSLDLTDPHAFMRSCDAHLTYQAWCDSEGRQDLDIRRFGRTMKAAGFKIVRRSQGSMIQGIKPARPTPSQPAFDLSGTPAEVKARFIDHVARKARKEAFFNSLAS